MTTTATSDRPALSRFIRNPDSGRVVVVQAPNLPLWVWIAATVVRLVLQPGGGWGQAVSVVGTVSLAIWAVLELLRGESPFRRVLGGLVLLWLGVALAVRLAQLI